MFVFKKTIEILCLSLLAKTQSLNSTELRETDFDIELEETEFQGDISLDDESESELTLIFSMSTRGARGKRNKDKKLQKQKTKKGKHVLKLLKYAEPDRKSRDWLEYGCYCFSDVKTDILMPGIGKAIDPIDQACRSLSECLKCSEFDFGISKKCHPHVGYKYQSNEDEELGFKSITCMDSIDSCQRSMCECDRRFLQTIQEYEFEREHSKNGGFQKEKSCPKKAQREADGQTGDNNGGKSKMSGRMNQLDQDGPQQCCGPLGERHLIKVSPTKGCCGQQTYNPFLFDCCADRSVEPVGSC